MSVKKCLIYFVVVYCVSAITPAQRSQAKDLVKDMFQHAYNGYMKFAFPQDELRPLSCSGTETYGEYSLTLLDALDTLAVFGEKHEFEKSVKWISKNVNFDTDINVSVFETNIRIMGALISAHLIAIHPSLGFKIEEYDDELLHLAQDLGDRLIVAFDTPTGIPYGTVNLRHGVPRGETPVVCTACAGSFLLEFGTLSRLLNNRSYEQAARSAAIALYGKRSRLGLYGAHINALTGDWTQLDASVGNYIDSYLEYLLKSYVLFGDVESLKMFMDSYSGAVKYLKNDGWWTQANMLTGQRYNPRFDTFQGFWPGVLCLLGDIPSANEFLTKIYELRDQLDFLPELYDINTRSVVPGRVGYPLRPELAESLFMMIEATKDPKYENAAYRMLISLQKCRTPCGFAAVKNVLTKELEDKMDSFFLSETLKYLYLIFDRDNWVRRENVIFTTEGHVISITQLHQTQKYSQIDDWGEKDEKIIDGLMAILIRKVESDPLSSELNIDFEMVKQSLKHFYKQPHNRHKLYDRHLPTAEEYSGVLSFSVVDQFPHDIHFGVPATCDVGLHFSDWRAYTVIHDTCEAPQQTQTGSQT